tara:strand:+ start:178 stop:690 length:513 start_codon:yes stop_codon:yes gene_type:complete
MKLSNKEAKKVYGLTQFVGGAGMSTAGYTRGIGWAYVFDVNGYKVTKNVFDGGYESYSIIGKNIVDCISMDVLNMSDVEKINEKLRVKLLSTIMNADLTSVIKIMADNKKGFTYFMNNVGGSKDLSFASVVQDYYSHKFNFVKDTNAIIKVMIKYGYEFTTMANANKLIR